MQTAGLDRVAITEVGEGQGEAVSSRKTEDCGPQNACPLESD